MPDVSKDQADARALKRKACEERELTRLLKEKAKPKFAGYAFLFLFIITLVYFTDEIATNIGKFLELDVTVYFFGSESAANASSLRSLTMTLIATISGVAMFLRPLADRFGRRIFLLIYTLGMGVAMVIIAISTGAPGWAIGTLLINMCIPHDMQQVYIQECAPKEKRGSYFFIIKGLATLSLMVVPVLKMLFQVDTYIENFKVVYGIIGAFGVLAAILAAIFMRESDVYLDARIKLLQMSEEEREQLKREKSDEAKRGGIISGLVYCVKNRQLRYILISFTVIMLAYVLTDNYVTILSCGYLAKKGIEISSAAYQAVSFLETQAVLTYPIGCGLIVLLPGFISDRFGRKKAAVLFGALALVLYVLFYFGSVCGWNAYVLGAFIGGACGAVWSCGDLLLLMVTESSVTNMRVSANAVVLMLGGIFYTIGKTVISAIGTATGDSYLGLVTIIMVLAGLAVGLILMLIKVKETVGVDLHNVNAINDPEGEE